MPQSEPILICFSYEYRSPAEAKVFEQIIRRYEERGLPTCNLFDAELHRQYEAGFNLARWEALDRHIKANDLFDRRIVMQDITDVYVADTDLEFHDHDVYVNRKKNCQYHAAKTLLRDLRSPDFRKINFSRRIDIDCDALDADGLKALFFGAKYRSIHRFSNDVLWGHGRSFVALHESLRSHIELVPDEIRFGNCDETLYTYFQLHLPDVPLNLRFGERFCQNHNYISQEILGAASGIRFLRSRRIFTYQHSQHVPDYIADLSSVAPPGSWRSLRSSLAYAIDHVVSGALSVASVVLQELKRLLIGCLFAGRRLFAPTA